jgi:hypothetical protein
MLGLRYLVNAYIVNFKLSNHVSLGSIHEDGLNFGLMSPIFWQDK